MRARPAYRAFSLAEVMLAMFILGIGIIAIASLFPAGIAQQRQSADDIIGPIVADNALSVLRTKLRPKDFGTFEDFGATPEFSSTATIRGTVPGDWPWRRPGFYLSQRTITLPGGTATTVRPGTISVFNNASALPDAAEPSGGIPWNPALYGSAAGSGPLITFGQRERYYPMHSDAEVNPPRSEYVWDCMFRRFQGQILVAIFVYRVSYSGGGAAPWAVPPNYSNASVPPMPVDLELGQPWGSLGPDPADPRDDAVIPGTDPGTNYSPANVAQNWQAPGQWMLDQNNNIMRVLSGRRAEGEGPVELVRPCAAVMTASGPSPPNYLGSPYYYITPPGGQAGLDGVATRIWFIPSEVNLDTDGDMSSDPVNLSVSLTPVYICVREL